MNKKVIGILGFTSSGKSTVAKVLETRGYHPLVIYTTRPPRTGEKEGKDYYFRNKEEFENLHLDEVRHYQTIYGQWSYGSYFKDYTDGTVVVLSPSYYEKVRDVIDITVFLDVDYATLFEKAKVRGDNLSEFERRWKSDVADFNCSIIQEDLNTGKIIVVDNKDFSLSPDELAAKIIGLTK